MEMEKLIRRIRVIGEDAIKEQVDAGYKIEYIENMPVAMLVKRTDINKRYDKSVYIHPYR